MPTNFLREGNPISFCRLSHTETLRRLGNDRELLAELYAAFAKDVPKKLSSLRAAHASGSPDELMKAAHSLKGACATIGAEHARHLALVLETAGREGDIGGTDQTLKELTNELAHLIGEISSSTF